MVSSESVVNIFRPFIDRIANHLPPRSASELLGLRQDDLLNRIDLIRQRNLFCPFLSISLQEAFARWQNWIFFLWQSTILMTEVAHCQLSICCPQEAPTLSFQHDETVWMLSPSGSTFGALLENNAGTNACGLFCRCNGADDLGLAHRQTTDCILVILSNFFDHISRQSRVTIKYEGSISQCLSLQNRSQPALGCAYLRIVSLFRPCESPGSKRSGAGLWPMI
jgi:hypothetical protein